ncbi:MAG TPA: hypothetical protein VHW09_28370 [Bryobacteraceae bacterium]|jgi:hypothetical protein|nr:hypothetical protein [Bryobacteraceae bacterium]
MTIPNKHTAKSLISTHTPGTTRGEDGTRKGAEPGRQTGTRTARDSTSINPDSREPIDPRMPHLPPA